TTTRTSSSASARASAADKASRSSWLMAFSLSGRLSVIQANGPRRSYSTMLTPCPPSEFRTAFATARQVFRFAPDVACSHSRRLLQHHQRVQCDGFRALDAKWVDIDLGNPRIGRRGVAEGDQRPRDGSDAGVVQPARAR